MKDEKFIFSETSITGFLPKKEPGITEIDYKKLVLANALNDWGVYMAGGQPPENFGHGMGAVSDFLGVLPTPNNLSGLADSLIKEG